MPEAFVPLRREKRCTMLLLAWSPITESAEIPPFGDALRRHLEGRGAAVRRASFAAWSLLFHTLAENGLPAGTVVFDANGKPGFADVPLFFSISHSGDVCAVAVSDRPVGADIERVREQYRPRLIERSLSAAEKAAFDGDFTRLWCRKEAVAKMTGEGITGYPDGIDTTQYRFVERTVCSRGQRYRLAAVTGG